MPSKFDKIKLNEYQDRRIKLVKADKERIKDLYATGGYSLNQLARKYNVSKKTILLTVNPESKKKNDDYIKEHWKQYYDKERSAIAARNLRAYKKELFQKGMLSLENAN